MKDERNMLGRFGHHPNPAIDFCVEVDCLEGMARNVCCGLDDKKEVAARIFTAMMFRVGGDEGAVKAKGRLRQLENMVNEWDDTTPNDKPATQTVLKPCPFCGTAPIYVTESDPNPPHNLRAWIKCPQCRQAQVCSDWYGGDMGTTDACWQTRAIDDAVKPLVEQNRKLREALRDIKLATMGEKGNYALFRLAADTLAAIEGES